MSHTLTFPIQGLNCGGCAARAQKALGTVAGLSNITVNLASHSAQITAPTDTHIADALAALDKAGYPAATVQDTFDVANLNCGGCVGRAERAISELTGVQEVTVNLATKTAQITYVQGILTPRNITEASTRAGYPMMPQSRSHSAPDTAEDHSPLTLQLLIAAALSLPVVILEMGGHLVPSFHMWVHQTIGQQSSWALQFLLTTAVLMGPGCVFYRLGLPALWRRAPDMNSLVALGTAAAYLYSCVALFAPTLLPETVRAVYFEAAAVIVVLILMGRLLEARAKGRTGAAIQKLMHLQPRTARVQRGQEVIEIDVDALMVGDLLHIRPGERIPTDGHIVEGESHVDEAMLTGEPIPAHKTLGDPVTGGTINGAGVLLIRATAVGAETSLAQIIRMVQQAQGAKLPIQTVVNHITLWFVPAVLGIATLTVALWLMIGGWDSLNYALVAGVSVLIIACPCAMGLATPTSIMVGTGRAAEMGVLFRKGDALQSLSTAKIIAFDKTGTLTQGRPSVTAFHNYGPWDKDTALPLIAALETGSEHPLARAIVAHADGLALPKARDFTAIAGDGATAQVGDHHVLVGTERLMSQEGIDITAAQSDADALSRAGQTLIYAAIDGTLAALIGVSDPIKPTSIKALGSLKSMGHRLVMITGDTEATAQIIAAQTGIDTVIARVRPDEKRAAIERLRRDGPVAFVGDGINDAPALAEADIGIALGTGTDVAIESADVVLMSGDLQAVVHACTVSGRTLQNIRQNLFWAFGYNVALVPIAAGALYPTYGLLLSPVLAAGAMALSSVFVLTNALRLRFVGGRA